ncbi:MAG: WecB/TagA/CpsF family glycosyltransferase, partial [Chloroflexi bacterium]|nr:WecB/TagA/CpsF family glycosyltransferase [Chloroflexota bacterium]
SRGLGDVYKRQVHGVMTGVQNAEHRHRLNQLDMIVPDGMPVRWAINWLYRDSLPDRVYGPTLTLKVCTRAAEEGLPVYLYGSTPAVIEKLSANLVDRFPSLQIAGASPSMFRQTTGEEMQQIAERIQQSGAAITFVGLGCPRQEVFVYEYRNLLNMPLLAVGAAFDFHAGTLAQAPPTMQRMGLEWFFRLVKEPKRLWRRYLFLNPAYLSLLALQLTGLHKFDTASTIPPTGQMRYG